MLRLLAQTVEAPPNFWVSLGVFSTTAAVLVAWIRFLIVQLNRKDDELAALHGELREARAEIRDTNKAQLELAERALPSLNETARLVAEASDELRRSRRQ